MNVGFWRKEMHSTGGVKEGYWGLVKNSDQKVRTKQAVNESEIIAYLTKMTNMC